jgi:Zn-dependent M28 family amino/carboxypeptidase
MKHSILSHAGHGRAFRTASAFAFVGVIALAAGCQSHHAAQAAPSPAPVVHPSFDQDRAWRYLTTQCALGPRVPGSAVHEACKDYIVRELTPEVDKVETQEFTYNDTHRHKELHLTNIIGVINPTATRKVMLFTHWDTRPTADQELDAVNKARPIPGADDGASGTAVLLELAHTFHEKRPNVGVVLLFVDGEDWGPGEDAMYLGARYYADHPGDTRPQYAVLLDMIGDKNLQIHRERYSEEHQPEIDNKIWGAAKDLGYSNAFPNDTKYDISDDHEPLNNAGIPAVDLIDFDYPYWHMLSDTPDKCSPTSLKAVGEVCAKVIYDERP